MRKIGSVLILALALLVPSFSSARRSDVHSYRYEQMWRSVVRLVRVDYGFTVRDRDEEVGYLLFDYVDSGRTHPASFELVRVQEDGREQVRVAVSIPAMPSYIERMLLDRLQRKLREEHGQPMPAPRPAAPAAPDEDDSEDEEDDNAS
ncbi:MAG: hypothetical protein ACI9KE_005893 [Polyangiales bacterium]|jgi:hypothetical protein